MMPRTVMAIEEHTHSNGGSSGSGSSRASKKSKQKKIPQRGLGVAQLERIRLEEQHKRGAAFQETSHVLAPDSVHLSKSSPSRMDLPSKNRVFRPAIEGFSSPKILKSSKPVNVSGSEVNWSAVSSPESDNYPRLWSCEYSPERGENHHGVVFGPNVNLPSELHNPILPLPGILQRSQQYQQPSCSSSMVNISSGISSSSVLNYQMEPPSNQNFHSSSYVPLWPEEVKMAGMKRPYPFSPEYPPVPAFNSKFSPGYVSLASRSSESASCSNECSASLESGNLLKREGSRTVSELKPRNVIRQNRACDGDFLTLAPPTAASPYQHSLTNSALRSQEILTLDSITCQGVTEEPMTCSGLNRFVQEPVFRFFPSPEVQIGQEGMNKVEIGGNVDLNLKL